MLYLILIYYSLLILFIFVFPKLTKKNRSIGKIQIIFLSLIMAILFLAFVFLNGIGFKLYHFSVYLFPIALLLLPEFRIVYNIEEKIIQEKFVRLLNSMFCEYTKIGKYKIKIKKVGIVRIQNFHIANLIIINRERNSPKSKVIFDNLFKIFYDKEY